MNHCMIDLETLSTRNDAACIAIGAVGFNKTSGIFCQFEALINPILAPGHRSMDTYNWWNQQDPKVRQRMFSGVVEPMTAYGSFCEWARSNKLSIIWGNDPQFDISILRSLGAHYRMESSFPFHFRSERSFRTMTWIAKMKGISYEEAYKEVTAHDALSDAKAQANAILLICKSLGLESWI